MGTTVALLEAAAAGSGPHRARSCAAYAAFSAGSAAAELGPEPPERRAAKVLQWATPIVCAPARYSNAS
jgi:hypothetical protein